MSGGSYNYTCFRIDEEYVGRMHDAELDELMKDIVGVTHDLEWWQSCDIGEDDYRKTVSAFKKKWFGKKDERPKAIECLIVRCKDCKHKPYSEDGNEQGFSVRVPQDDEDKFICPCICDDGWYSYIPEDDFYCANGERNDKS